MSVGGFVVFALGLVCGVGVALYLVRRSDAAPGERRGGEPGVGVGGERDDMPPPGSETGALEDGSSDREELEEWLDETFDDGGPEESASIDEPGGTEAGLELARSDGQMASAPPDEGRTGAASGSGVPGEYDERGRPDRPAHWLEGLRGSVADESYRLREEVSVGRLPRNDLQLTEGDVSRVHCRFRIRDERVVVEALDTVNGTRVNDEDVPPGEPAELDDGDVVEIGNVVFVYHRRAEALGEDGLAEASSEHGIGVDARTVTVDTTGWRERIVSELELADGDVSAAAQALGMERDTLERLTDQLDIEVTN